MTSLGIAGGSSDFETQTLRPPTSLNSGNSFSFIERIHSGIHSDTDSMDIDGSPDSPSSELRFEGPGQTVGLKGSICIHKVYQDEKESHLRKIILGASVIFSLVYTNEIMWPVALVALLCFAVKSGANVFQATKLPRELRGARIELLVEAKIAGCYALYSLGFLLLFLRVVSASCFLYFSFPYLLLSLLLLFLKSEESPVFNNHRFAVFEALQLFLVALKFTNLNFFSWNSSLLYFKLCCAVMIAFGLILLTIILASVFKPSNTSIQQWKIKGVVAMMWNYLTTGVTYFAMTKGVVVLMDGEEEAEMVNNLMYGERFGSSDILMLASIFLIIVSLANFIIHIALRKEIKLFLAKVIYPEESKRQISLRFFNKSFEFGLVRVSAAYFNFDQSSQPAQHGEENDIDNYCVICFDNFSDIVLKPCGHSGLCRACVLKSIAVKGQKCPICRCRICNIFFISFEKEQKQYRARGEIRVHC